jgi:hypothetical protein
MTDAVDTGFRLTPAVLRRLRLLARDSHCIAGIATEIGATPAQVRRLAADHGIALRRRQQAARRQERN